MLWPCTFFTPWAWHWERWGAPFIVSLKCARAQRLTQTSCGSGQMGLRRWRWVCSSWRTLSCSSKAIFSKGFTKDAPNQEDHTFLGPSTSRVSRQARKYHRRAGTDFVAVFDWCSMIIFDFGGMDEGSYRLAKGTWHQEGPHLPAHGTFRMLLLGMLITSMRRFGVIQ